VNHQTSESGTPARKGRSNIVNALTIDVEDYFQVSAFERVVARSRWHEYESRVASNTDRLLGTLAETGVTATFFVLGWVAERDPSIVRRIASAGHEIASHGFGHRLVYDLSPDEFRDDVRRGKAVVEAAAGRSVRGYRAPSFSITERSLWALDVLIEEGFAYDASIFPIRHDRYGIPTAPRHPFWVSAGAGTTGTSQWHTAAMGDLLEIPSSTIRIGGSNLPVGGGGYFRLLPYWWTRHGIRRLNEVEGRPAVFYLHPWEVDPRQPRLGGSRLSRFRHYRNLAKTEARLRQLLADFRFGTITEAFLAPATRAA
jgi:polysaccharide deacetylase family protein (PEP-CTERM system associated)